MILRIQYTGWTKNNVTFSESSGELREMYLNIDAG